MEIRLTSSIKTEKHVVFPAPPDAGPMRSGERDFQPERVALTYANYHDGRGWTVSGTVSGRRILKDETLGRQLVTGYIGVTADTDPEWAPREIAHHHPPNQFDVSPRPLDERT